MGHCDWGICFQIVCFEFEFDSVAFNVRLGFVTGNFSIVLLVVLKRIIVATLEHSILHLLSRIFINTLKICLKLAFQFQNLGLHPFLYVAKKFFLYHLGLSWLVVFLLQFSTLKRFIVDIWSRFVLIENAKFLPCGESASFGLENSSKLKNQNSVVFSRVLEPCLHFKFGAKLTTNQKTSVKNTGFWLVEWLLRTLFVVLDMDTRARKSPRGL